MEKKKLHYGGEFKDKADEGMQGRVNSTKELLEKSFGNLCNKKVTSLCICLKQSHPMTGDNIPIS